MHSEVGAPHSVLDGSLSKVPLLEVVTLVLLVSWVKFGRVNHLVHQLTLLETLVHQ